MMTVRPLTVRELPLCEGFAREFYAEKQIPGAFDMQKFLNTWTFFLTTYHAAVFTLWRDETLIGGLGATITPDLYDGRLTATELFWFVTKEERKGSGAWLLVEAFEAWALEQHAVELRLAFLLTDMADQENPLRLLPIYKRKKYRPADVTCIKTLGGSPCPL